MNDIKIRAISDGIWHTELKVGMLQLVNGCGCGIMMLKDWSRGDISRMNQSLLILIQLIKDRKLRQEHKLDYSTIHDIGSIITVVGNNYFNTPKEEILRSVGFEEVSIYNNPRHGHGYKQKLYLLKIQ